MDNRNRKSTIVYQRKVTFTLFDIFVFVNRWGNGSGQPFVHVRLLRELFQYSHTFRIKSLKDSNHTPRFSSRLSIRLESPDRMKKGYLLLSTLFIRLVQPLVVSLSEVYNINVGLIHRLDITLPRIGSNRDCAVDPSYCYTISRLDAVNLNKDGLLSKAEQYKVLNLLYLPGLHGHKRRQCVVSDLGAYHQETLEVSPSKIIQK
jgi:hypothetical protein